jgi:Protein of unknown function (DUF2934)
MPTQRRSITRPRDQGRPPLDQPTTSPDDDPAMEAEAVPEVEPAADDGTRRRRIAERAYRLAERRGFTPGQELDDWLAAEAEEREGEGTESER